MKELLFSSREIYEQKCTTWSTTLCYTYATSAVYRVDLALVDQDQITFKQQTVCLGPDQDQFSEGSVCGGFGLHPCGKQSEPRGQTLYSVIKITKGCRCECTLELIVRILVLAGVLWIHIHLYINKGNGEVDSSNITVWKVTKRIWIVDCICDIYLHRLEKLPECLKLYFTLNF